jgi:hypothetical protein
LSSAVFLPPSFAGAPAACDLDRQRVERLREQSQRVGELGEPHPSTPREREIATTSCPLFLEQVDEWRPTLPVACACVRG